MLVRPHPAGWRIVFHPAHGLLASSLYRQLENTLPEDLHLPTLLAVAQHDDHQLDFNSGNYLTERGAPKDFTLMAMDDAQRSLQAEGLLEDAYRKHAWTYLLIGRHYEFLYDGQKVDERLQTLLTDIRARRDTLLKARNWDREQLELAYGYLRFCDRLSLILCGEDVPTGGRQLEINDALGETAFLRRETEDGSCLSVTPWPFTATEFTVEVECFMLDRLSFPTSEALGETLSSATAEVQRWALGETTPQKK